MSLHRGTVVSSVEYAQRADGSVELRKVQCVQFISRRHVERLKAVRSEQAARYSGSNETAPSMGDMNKLIKEKLIQKIQTVVMPTTGRAVESDQERGCRWECRCRRDGIKHGRHVEAD